MTMNFPVAMLLLGVCFVCGAFAFAKVMAYFGVRKFIEEDEKTNIKPH